MLGEGSLNRHLCWLKNRLKAAKINCLDRATNKRKKNAIDLGFKKNITSGFN